MRPVHFLFAFLLAVVVTGTSRPSAAQSGGLLSSSDQVNLNQKETQALQQYGQQGGTLMPQTTVKRCDENTTSIGAPPAASTNAMGMPKSLLDEEMNTGRSGNTAHFGDITIICQ